MGRIYDRLVADFAKAPVFKDVDSIPLVAAMASRKATRRTTNNRAGELMGFRSRSKTPR